MTVTIRAERAREGGEAAGETCTQGPRPGGLRGDPRSRGSPTVFPHCSRTTDRETEAWTVGERMDGGRKGGKKEGRVA